MSFETNVSQWLESFKHEENFPNLSTFPRFKQVVRRPVSISITGGKGGVGKTSISLKYALELKKIGYKVLYIDFDYNLSNSRIKLGLPLDDNFKKLLRREIDFDSALYKNGNFHMLSGCNGDVDIFDEQSIRFDNELINLLASHEKDYDFILFDCPAGINKDALSINAYCDHRFIVVTADKSSITDSYSLIKVLKLRYGVNENHLIVNKVENLAQYKKVVKTISETAENFLGVRTSVLGGISNYRDKPEEFDYQFLFEENSKIHKDFLKVLNVTAEKCLHLVPCVNPVHGIQEQVLEKEVQTI
ncbi:MAG: AAA family ATPase [Bacteriovoracaceae bacterium]|jgi:flagellar biosynthesis protein FlhG|nr:AAA family ATPase [Bacteriovoracaceae bacterium]